jgi:hypothetical protein
VRRLTELLEQPVRVGRNPPRKSVWHCSIRTHPTDRTLSDAQWAHISGEVMAAVGLAPHGDARAVRWVAVRHAPDHVHVVATLVRQDRRTAWTTRDYRKAQQTCRDLEERYGLYRVAPPGAGSRRWPRPAELNKAARPGASAGRASGKGRAPALREVLRQRVRAVAAVAVDEADFFARLTRSGVLVKVRHSARQPGQVSGYAVGLDGHTTPGGDTVWYGGGRLAADLTLPRLRTRWAAPVPDRPRGGPAARLAAADAFPAPPGVYQRAADTAAQAAAAMRAATTAGEASAIAGAAADVLSAAALAWEGRGGPLSDAADVFDRAAHEPRRLVPARRVSQAMQLRAIARLISVMGALSRGEDTMAALYLVYTLAALAESLADLREAQDRLHQARDARAAAGQLRAYTPPAGAAPARAPAGPSRYQPARTGPPFTDRRDRQR